MLARLFNDHPASVGESYLEHLCVASGFAFWLLVAGLACLVHAFLPCLFEKTGSRIIDDLHETMVRNRRRRPASADPASGLAGKA